MSTFDSPDVVTPNGAEAADTAPDPLTGLHEVTARLQEDLRSVAEQAGLREQVIARLHEENERLRAGERSLILRPVQTDLQRLRTDLLRQAATLPDQLSAEAVRGLLTSFAVDVELALDRCGIKVFRPEAGSAFDPAQHRAAEVLAATSAEFDSVVAEVVSDGYLDTTNDRVVGAATVKVWRWQGAAPTAVRQ